MRTKISKDDFAELFLLQVRGAMASAFVFSGVQPGREQWDMLRGLTDPNMRDLGAIGYQTGYNMNLQLSDVPTERPPHDHED